MRVTIDVSGKWLHGEGPKRSQMLRTADDRACCLGIICHDQGVPWGALRGRGTPRDVNRILEEEPGNCHYPIVNFLISTEQSRNLFRAMGINDMSLSKAREWADEDNWGRHTYLLEFLTAYDETVFSQFEYNVTAIHAIASAAVDLFYGLTWATITLAQWETARRRALADTLMDMGIAVDFVNIPADEQAIPTYPQQ